MEESVELPLALVAGARYSDLAPRLVGDGSFVDHFFAARSTFAGRRAITGLRPEAARPTDIGAQITLSAPGMTDGVLSWKAEISPVRSVAARAA